MSNEVKPKKVPIQIGEVDPETGLTRIAGWPYWRRKPLVEKHQDCDCMSCLPPTY